MYRLRAGRVEFTVHHARTSRHALNFIGPEHLLMSHAVLMGQRTFQDIAENLHVAMPVGAESPARGHAVLIDHLNTPETPVLRIVIVGKRKRLIRIEPAMFRVPAFLTLTDVNHLFRLW